jgi:para-nitrobenzyl esterase
MSGMLLQLARTGQVSWPRYELSKRATMIFDARSRVENDPRGAERRLFARVPFVQAGT